MDVRMGCAVGATGRAWWTLAAVGTITMSASPVHAVPGPDSVVVVSNANLPESMALGDRYAEARQLPARQVCRLDLPDAVTIPLDDFRTRAVDGLATCLADAGVTDRIEAVVLARGVPLRVTVPDGGSNRLVSFAAALSLWRSALTDGTPVIGEAPGRTADCGGTPCYAPTFRNPFTSGVFEAGWTQSVPGIEWAPLLVTMLHGYSYEEAEGLIDSAVTAEAAGGAEGEFLFMDGRDPARGVLDVEYPSVMSELGTAGYTNAARVPFDTALTGRSLAAFFTGTATLGDTIEGNTFAPGALVDNLTSFGAVPANFDPAASEQQVSIARWVAMGVAGAHGTTAEPLNGAFPSRRLILDYIHGGTLAEAYHRRIPVAYWQNLVLGDPMLAPYAVRPQVALEGVADADTVGDARSIAVQATDPEGLGVDSVLVLLDGLEIARADGNRVELCLDVPEGEVWQLLAVAQKTDDGSTRGLHRPKGWTVATVTGAAGSATCPPPDAGTAADAGPSTDGSFPDAAATDAGRTPGDGDGGCGCQTPGGPPAGSPLMLLLAVLLTGGLGHRSRRPTA